MAKMNPKRSRSPSILLADSWCQLILLSHMFVALKLDTLVKIPSKQFEPNFQYQRGFLPSAQSFKIWEHLANWGKAQNYHKIPTFQL